MLKTISIRPNPKPARRRRKAARKKPPLAVKLYVIELVELRGMSPVFSYWTGKTVTSKETGAKRYRSADATRAARALQKTLFKNKRWRAIRVVPA